MRVFVIVITLLLSSFAAGAQQQQQRPPQRIISFIPALTEMLFAIGAGPRVVAVGSFDEYPPEVKKLERVGALLDPDLERILSLKPDLVTVYGSQADLQRQLDRAGIPTFQYRHAGLVDVAKTIRELGTQVGQLKEAEALTTSIQQHLDRIRQRVSGRPRPRTMIVFGREALALRGIYASGGRGFLHDMLMAAGGDNIFADVQRESIQATSELILARRPEAIIELRVGDMPPDQQTKEIEVWNRLSSVPAVQSKRVFFLTDARTVVPGPRVAEGTELLARALHPDVFR